MKVHYVCTCSRTVLLYSISHALLQVTCEVVEPRPSRPHEGKVSIAVHLSPMAAPHFEPGRGNDLVDELQQILDRNIKESRCLDLESLCIMAEESVWQLRLDVTVSLVISYLHIFCCTMLNYFIVNITTKFIC